MDQPAFVPSLGWVAPFACFLVGIAFLPLLAPAFWESNLRKLTVSLVFGLPVGTLYLMNAPDALVHAATDYASFIVLLGSLFVIAGGVNMDGDLEATPAVNTAFLAAGSILASLIGTTGASMLLIRPLLHTNSERRYVTHTVVFFIFLVSNIGGSLTPLGDPPLFLGYLQGVPFTWTFRLAPIWLAATMALLAVYYLWDRRLHGMEPPERLRLDATRIKPLRVLGQGNLILLVGIVLAAAVLTAPWRELVMVGLAVVSWARTSPLIHRANHFHLDPVVEVVVVFAGIFLTMMPALDVLRARGSMLGVTEPWQFFWATGVLSSFLDNAPTYMAFLALAQGQNLPADVVGMPHEVLLAISAGAVFMGANTYIGNGPNFMVRSIAESRGVKMPSVFGFMAYSGAILLPLFLLLTFLFF